MNSLAIKLLPYASPVKCPEDELVVLRDGRTISVLLVWFPRLTETTPG